MTLAVGEFVWLCWFLGCGVVADVPFYNLEGVAGDGYYLGITIGSPPQNFNVLVDTGSANLAIAAAPFDDVDKYFQYNRSDSFKSFEKEVSVTYTQGFWQGTLGNDIVMVPRTNASQEYCDFVLIKSAHDFFTNNSKWQGILGLAYSGLLHPYGESHPWLSSIRNPPVFNLTLCGHQPGSLTLQGNFSVYSSYEHHFLPFTATVLHKLFYQVVISDIWINNKPLKMPCLEFNNDKTVVDSGTTHLKLPRKVFHEVVHMMSNELQNNGLNISIDFWKSKTLLCFDTIEEHTQFPNLKFGLVRSDGQFFTVELTSESYLQYMKKMAALKHCYLYAIEPSDEGSVLGSVFLEGLVAIFDQINHSVSFMEANCGPSVRLKGPFQGRPGLLDCGFWDGNKTSSVVIVTGAVAAVLGSLIIAAILYQYILPSDSRFKSIWFTKGTNHLQLLGSDSEADSITP